MPFAATSYASSGSGRVREPADGATGGPPATPVGRPCLPPCLPPLGLSRLPVGLPSKVPVGLSKVPVKDPVGRPWWCRPCMVSKPTNMFISEKFWAYLPPWGPRILQCQLGVHGACALHELCQLGPEDHEQLGRWMLVPAVQKYRGHGENEHLQTVKTVSTSSS
jgi:hypothetical protein